MEHDLQPFGDHPGQAFVAAGPVVFDRSPTVATSERVAIGYESANPALRDALWPDAVYGLLNRLDRR